MSHLSTAHAQRVVIYKLAYKQQHGHHLQRKRIAVTRQRVTLTQ